jgi:hypothetical protein
MERRKRRSFTEEFKAEAVRLVWEGSKTPATARQGLVDWGEGNATWVYLFEGKEWHATSHRSEEG